MKQHYGLSRPRTGESPAATRRLLFGQAAKLTGAGALALVTFLPVVAGGADLAAKEIARGDIEILERLVASELMMGAMFGTALSRFTSDDGSSGDRLLPTQPTLTRIWYHDLGHRALLKERLEVAASSTQPKARADEQFQLETFAAFLRTAAELKNASVAGYVESVAALETPSLRKVVAGILAVEARHAAYLSARIDEPAFTTETEGLVPTSELLEDEFRFALTNRTMAP